MDIVVKLDPDVEELLRNDARNRNVDFDVAVNDAVRAGFVRIRGRQRFVQKTYSAGSDHLDLTHALALEAVRFRLQVFDTAANRALDGRVGMSIIKRNGRLAVLDEILIEPKPVIE
jgi:hypothetical protein